MNSDIGLLQQFIERFVSETMWSKEKIAGLNLSSYLGRLIYLEIQKQNENRHSKLS